MTLEEIEARLQEDLDTFPCNLNEAISHFLAFLDEDSNSEGLIALLRSECLHRMFWTELIKDENANSSLTRVNGWNSYYSDNIMIDHEILSAEFWDVDIDDMAMVGGALCAGDNYWGERPWIKGIETFEIDKYDAVLAGYQGNTGEGEQFASMSEILKFGGFAFKPGKFGPVLLALANNDIGLEFGKEANDLSAQWGFSLNEHSDKYISEGLLEFSDGGQRDVDASLNEDFSESLSWAKLDFQSKSKLLEILVNGITFTNLNYERQNSAEQASLSKNAQHFLACMALCESTPEALITRLESLDDELVNGVLEFKELARGGENG